MNQCKRPIAILMALILLFSSAVYAAPTDAASAESSVSNTFLTETAISGEVTRVREEESLRTTNSETYLLSDGTYECVVYAEDKYYQDENSALKRIDNSIVPENSSEISTNAVGAVTAYKNAANVFDARFSTGGTPEVSLTYGGSSLSFSPVQAVTQGNVSLMAQSSALSVGRVQNETLAQLTATGSNTATYTNAFPNADLVYVLENSLLKEYIILKSAAASNTYSFLFQMDGVTLQTTGRNPGFVDTEGTTVFALADLFAIDANGKPTDALTYSLQSTGKRDEIIITVTLDEAYLAAPERAFPVVIDPSTMVSSVETADTCVCSAFPTTNYYTSSYLRTGKDTDFGVRRSYIKFNLPTIPVQAVVTSSKLEVEMLSGATPELYVYRNTGAWTSSTLTWNNKPAFTHEGASGKAVAQGNNWYAATVTNIVKSWYSNQNAYYGFVMIDGKEYDTNHWTTFYSSDAVSPHKPELHINYSLAGSADISTNALYYIMNGGKYLRATATSTFSMESGASTTNSKELWYFEKVSAGIYRIESLGVRNSLYAGRERNMLTVLGASSSSTTANLALNAYSTTSNNQLWELQGSASSGYYIVSHAYPQLVLTLNGSTPTLSSNENASKWILSSKTYSDYFDNGFMGSTAPPYTLNLIIESSAVTGYWTESIFQCYTEWTEVYSNISFRYYSPSYTGTYATADCTIRVRGKDLDNDGVTAQMKSSTGYNDDIFDLVYIYLGTGSGEKSCNTSNYTNTDREKAFLHELGHALKLRHPHETNTEEDNGWHPQSIMCQGAPSKAEFSYVPSRPSGYDICNLKRKWG